MIKKEEMTMFCSNCGKELPSRARFCIFCGHSAALKPVQQYNDPTHTDQEEAYAFTLQSEDSVQQPIYGKTAPLAADYQDTDTL